MEQLATWWNWLLIIFLVIGWPVYLYRAIRCYGTWWASNDPDMWNVVPHDLRFIALLVFPVGATLGWAFLYDIFITKDRKWTDKS